MTGYAIGGPDQGGTGKTWPDYCTLTVKAGEAITAGQAVGFFKTAGPQRGLRRGCGD
jgi:hypothetical protein